MQTLKQIFFSFQQTELPIMEAALEPLTDLQQKLAAILSVLQIPRFIPPTWQTIGRPMENRLPLAQAFVAKMVYNLGETRELIELLISCPMVRKICGWNSSNDIPSESTFSRAFAEFAASSLPKRVHDSLIEQLAKEKMIGHISRDSTDIVSREKAAKTKTKKQIKSESPKKKRGRPKKGEVRPPPEPTRLERQKDMTLDEMIEELPKKCDYGVKKKDGEIYKWKGYSFHIDWADGGIPISAIITSASVHDSQVAIPLITLSSGRVVYLYDLMDAAYDAKDIKNFSKAKDHVPIIRPNPRRGETIDLEPATKRRYAERTTAERGNSMLKESFGGGFEVRYRGFLKVTAHLMFALTALAADRILNLFM